MHAARACTTARAVERPSNRIADALEQLVQTQEQAETLKNDANFAIKFKRCGPNRAPLDVPIGMDLIESLNMMIENLSGDARSCKAHAAQSSVVKADAQKPAKTKHM